MVRLPLALALALALAPVAPHLHAATIPEALLVLEAPPSAPGSDPKTAAPALLVLLEDGQVFVGGTGGFETTRLEKKEVESLRRTAGVLRKAGGKAGRLAFPGDGPSLRLRLPNDDDREILIDGDPAAAGASQAAAAAALDRLRFFHHPNLRPYHPPSYAVRAREEGLAGGCRAWRFAFPIDRAVAGPVVVSPAEAEGWPAGAWPASVCVGDRRYVVNLRPLLPGEQP